MIVETVAQLSEAQIADLERLYQGEWWTQGRERADIRRMLAHSVVVAFCETDGRRLVAFARVLTDYVYKALIFDVIVDPAYRGTGLGRMLIDAIVNHPDLREVRHFELYCLPELVPFYEQWGFTDDLGRLRFMRRAAGAAR
jgi:GNAT superfamily N-acetyltransferase